MSKSSTRTLILITGLFTAIVHLVMLNVLIGELDLLFTLNGMGYLVLLALFFFNPGFVATRRPLLHYAFMGFTALTIVAFLAVGGTGFGGAPLDPLGWITKLAELLLIVALWLDLRNERSAAA